ncbi:phiSA1p31-related protein [Streptomyces sp. NPDC048438]|uniref:phiSA1p31-related protein n=1 Tax=Streptomyces sp. NPDC048438 TaxID=3365551 RepID=UPI0037135952
MTTTTFETLSAGQVDLDLDRAQDDVFGHRWTWTGVMDETGMAMMETGDDTDLPATLRLSFVYEMFGPLIPAPRPVTAADRRAALTRPACTTPSHQAEPVPTPRTFAGLLGRLRGRSA